MGGALGLALRRAGRSVAGYARRQETVDRALALGVVDEGSTCPADVLQGADVVVCCLPVLTIPPFLAQHASHFAPGAVVTDVGSTKRAIMEAMEGIMAGTGACFIGSHPICGSEQQGIEAARADLYQGAVTVLTPPDDVDPRMLERLSAFWTSVGCHVLTLAAERHDQYLARTSHLPHLVASLLCRAVGRGGVNDRLAACCGSGYRDVSRLAEGSSEIWSDILLSNREAVSEEVRALRCELERFLDILNAADPAALDRFLDEAAHIRRSLLGRVEARTGTRS